jgi:uncharacterized membrane protein YtjA (UPF0391 family)
LDESIRLLRFPYVYKLIKRIRGLDFKLETYSRLTSILLRLYPTSPANNNRTHPLVFLESTAAAYAFSSREGDPAGAAVIAFYLFAVFMHQTGSGIHHDKFVKWTALVFFILSLFAILKSV